MAGTRPGGIGGPAEVLDTGLVPVANKPLIVHALEALHAAGVREAAIVADPDLAPSIRTAIAGEGHGLRLRFLSPQKQPGVIGALRSARDFLAGRSCLVHSLDGIVGPRPLCLAEELADDDADAIFLAHRATPGERSLLGLSDQRLLRLSQPRPEGLGLTLTGIALLSPALLERVFASKPTAPAELSELVEAAVADGARCLVQPLRGWWRPVADQDDLLDANRLLLDSLDDEGSAHPEGADIQGRVWIHPTACLENTVIRGPAVIGADAQLRYAYVGPYTSVGDGVVVEGAEVEHSILLAGASIRNLGRRLEASVVGRHTRVFRDFALPRALRLRVGDGDEISLA